MFSTQNLSKILIVLFISLAIPSALSVYKDFFDEAVAAAKSNILGANVVRIQTTNNPGISRSRQRVLIDLFPQRSGQIRNLSQRAFNFPKATAASAVPLVNNNKLADPVECPSEECVNNPVYEFVLDGGRGTSEFNFAYQGTLDADNKLISFRNSNNYDLNNVTIRIEWIDGSNNTIESGYSTCAILKGQSFVVDRTKTLGGTAAFDPTKTIRSIKVTFTDNSNLTTLPACRLL